MSPIHKVAFRVHETIVWDTPPDPADPADPPDPAEVVSLSAAQTLPSHAPGVRMTVVINILPQTITVVVKVFCCFMCWFHLRVRMCSISDT